MKRTCVWASGERERERRKRHAAHSPPIFCVTPPLPHPRVAAVGKAFTDPQSTIVKMSGRQGGKIKPLKAPKKQVKELVRRA